MEESIYDDLLGILEEVKMNSDTVIDFIKSIRRYNKNDDLLEDEVIGDIIYIIESVEDLKDLIGYNK